MTAPDSVVPPVPAALCDDARLQLELACVDLICQFESMLTSSSKERLMQCGGAIVTAVERSLQAASEFGEIRLTGDTLALLNKRISEARECSRSLRNAVSSFEWKAVRQLIGRPSANELDVLRIHSELGQATAMVVVAALGPAIEVLGVESKSGAEILRIVKLFVAELQQRW